MPPSKPPHKLASARALLGARSLPSGTPRWCLREITGRLVELAGWRSGAVYSSAATLIVDAQKSGEPVVWIGPKTRTFLPADAQDAGVDLAALPIVRVPTTRDIPFAADVIARSGAFGLILLDVGTANPAMGVLSRLAGLARTHNTAIVMLTEKSPEHPSLGSVVSFRADTSFARHRDGGFEHVIAVSRDRVRSMAWRHVEVRRGPAGLS